MSYFHTAWMEIYIKVWLCSPYELMKFRDVFYLLKHRAENRLYLICAHLTFTICIYVDTYVTFKT